MEVDSQCLQTLKDPVCGMKVTEKSPNIFNYKNKPIYFYRAAWKCGSFLYLFCIWLGIIIRGG